MAGGLLRPDGQPTVEAPCDDRGSQKHPHDRGDGQERGDAGQRSPAPRPSSRPRRTDRRRGGRTAGCRAPAGWAQRAPRPTRPPPDREQEHQHADPVSAAIRARDVDTQTNAPTVRGSPQPGRAWCWSLRRRRPRAGRTAGWLCPRGDRRSTSRRSRRADRRSGPHRAAWRTSTRGPAGCAAGAQARSCPAAPSRGTAPARGCRASGTAGTPRAAGSGASASRARRAAARGRSGRRGVGRRRRRGRPGRP